MRKGSNELTALNVDDVTLMDDLEIAESMNSYFSAVFTSEDYGISLHIVRSWILNYQLSFVTQMRFLAF